jgi:biopolymer transport protein ExbB
LRASGRSAAMVHGDLKRGVNSLATIASVAPLLGLLITVDGMVSSFGSCGGEKSTCMAAVVGGLSDAIARGAFGLLVGIASLWCYRYLRSKLDDLDVEMKNVTLELANTPTRLLRWSYGVNSTAM